MRKSVRHGIGGVLLAAVVTWAGPAGAERFNSFLGDVDRFFQDMGRGFDRMLGSSTRQVVPFGLKYEPGSIVISTAERRLYYVLPGGQAVRYGVGVGRDGFQWGGVSYVSRKSEWPDWRPPEEMLQRRPDIPAYMPGGPDNPLGARALYLGDTLYRIHGTNESHTIGSAVSSGCIRLLNRDVIDLYERVRIGAKVYVYQ